MSEKIKDILEGIGYCLGCLAMPILLIGLIILWIKFTIWLWNAL